MSNYFTSPDDLKEWVKSRKSSDEAATELMGIIGQGNAVKEEQSIVDTCRSIYDNSDENASSVLFGVLAKHNLTTMKKEAQSQSRQRNGWVRGMRNKWNRVVDGFNDGTPWRIDRDKMYNFTHYYTDAISFDEDPSAVYSGEAIWRNYIMDKYSREYQDKNGKWVGGYINNRFYVFPDAGTPANPRSPRDGGNQMGLALGERTRKPRPHQWSVERRLEDARGVETHDIEAKSFNGKVVKIASSSLAEDRHENQVYNIFRDTLDMREAGFEYEDMINKIAEHYSTSIINVAQIDLEAQRLLNKHSNVMYRIEKTAQIQARTTFVTNEDIEIMPSVDMAQPAILPKGTTIVSLNGDNSFQALNCPNINVFSFMNGTPFDKLTNLDAESDGHTIQDAADETGLNESPSKETEHAVNTTSINSVSHNDTEFPVIER